MAFGFFVSDERLDPGLLSQFLPVGQESIQPEAPERSFRIATDPKTKFETYPSCGSKTARGPRQRPSTTTGGKFQDAL